MEKRLKVPLTFEDISDLQLGDIVYFDGLLFTGRSQFHIRALKQGIIPPIDFSQANVMLHVGPVLRPTADGWEPVAVDPTSSVRFERYGADLIKKLGLRALIGKTTMGEKTMRAAREYGCIHVSKIGIYGRILSWRIKKVVDVYYLDELGMTEATWLYDVENFGPFVVDIDVHGNNLFHQLREAVDDRRRAAYQALGIDESFDYTPV